MAKHLMFFQTGVLRPSLIAVLVVAAIATISTPTPPQGVAPSLWATDK